MLGIALHARLPHWLWAWTAFSAICIITAHIAHRRAVLSSAFIATGVFAAAVASSQLVNFQYPRDHISHFASDSPRLAQLELHITHAPRILTQPPGQHRAIPPKQVAAARVERVYTRRGWIKAGGDVLIQIGEPHPQLAINHRVRVIGLLQRPGPAMNPGQFDWAEYYREQRILASVQIPHAENLRIIEANKPPLLARLREQARRELARGFAAAESLDHALLRALLLGDNDPELRDVQDQFRRTGTSHHLAISGMHVAVLGAVIFGICHLLLLSPRMSCVIAMSAVALYGLVALPSPPVVRSVLLCLAFSIGILSRRAIDPIQLLSLSVLAMLAYHPMDLFNAGFQLSFGTVLGLMVFTPLMMRLIWRDDPDAVVLRSLKLQTRRAAISYWIRRKLAAVFCAAVVAWLVSTPLVMYHFEQLNPWSIAASILMAPVVFLALIGGFAKVLLTVLWPSMAQTWAVAAATPVAWMRGGVDLLAMLPGSDVPLPAPAIPLIILFYVLLALPLVPWRRPIVGYCVRCGPATACLLLPLVALQVGFTKSAAPTREMRVTVLAVGAGQCIVVVAPDRSLTLLDAGSISIGDLQRRCIGPFIRHHGRREVRRLVLSHSDFDHISAAQDVASAYDVREILISPHFTKDDYTDPPAEQLMETLRRLERPPRAVLQGERLDWGGATAEILWPPPTLMRDANNSALVLRLSFAGRSILLPADVQDPAMSAMLAGGLVPRADVLVAPHHGSAERTTRAFIDAAAPSIIVSSNDRTLSMKQRVFDEVAGPIPLLRTNRCGAVTIRIAPDGAMTVETFLTDERFEFAKMQ